MAASDWFQYQNHIYDIYARLIASPYVLSWRGICGIALNGN